MASIIYLSLNGKEQGLISQGCGSKASIGNKFQLGHENEIFVLAMDHSMSREQNVQHHPLTIIKPIDKSTPLLAQSMNNNEELEAEFSVYRTAENGGLEFFFAIRLGDAIITSINQHYPHSVGSNAETPQETISFKYRDITWEHKTAATSSFSFWKERVMV